MPKYPRTTAATKRQTSFPSLAVTSRFTDHLRTLARSEDRKKRANHHHTVHDRQLRVSARATHTRATPLRFYNGDRQVYRGVMGKRSFHVPCMLAILAVPRKKHGVSLVLGRVQYILQACDVGVQWRL